MPSRAVTFRGPSGGGLEFSGVGNVIALVARTRLFQVDRRLFAAQALDHFEQFQQADRVPQPAADVERLPGKRVDIGLRQQKRIHQIVRKQNVANLHAISEHRDRLSFQGSNQEMRHPALVLIAHLVRPVDAAHAEHHGRQSEGPRIVEHILIRRAFRAAVRTVEIQRSFLADAGTQRGVQRLIARAILFSARSGNPPYTLFVEVKSSGGGLSSA